MPILVLLADGASIHIRSGVSGFFRTCVEKKDMSTFANPMTLMGLRIVKSN
jgi:hypothetical protein